MHCQSNFVSLFLLVHGLNNLYAMMDCARRQYEVPQTLSSKSKLRAHMILNWINFLSSIASIHIYAGLKNLVLTNKNLYAMQSKRGASTKSPKYLVRREVEMILRCTEFFWSEVCKCALRSDKKFETSKRAQLNAK